MGKFKVTLCRANYQLLSLNNEHKVGYAQVYICHLLEIEILIYFKDTLESKLNQQNKSTEKRSLGLRKPLGRSDI